MRVLVVGGAGYIGSHTVKALRAAGHEPVVFDSLVTGHREAIRGVPLVEGEIADRAAILEALKRHRIEAVLHFAAKCYVGESVEQPEAYYRVNLGGGISLASACLEAGVKRMVFSSTCATYGVPPIIPIPEETPRHPVNPYGRTKNVFEWLLEDFERAYGFGWVALRYFNAAGCDPDGELGEDHDPETHLIPNVIAAALGRKRDVTIFGTDYPTRDGTCVRDYIHVADLAKAHVLALKLLEAPGGRAMNLGTGTGYTVREVVEEVRKVSGRNVPVTEGPRRPGDPPELVAALGNAPRLLGWRPRHSELQEIVRTAWAWHSKHPEGYAKRGV